MASQLRPRTHAERWESKLAEVLKYHKDNGKWPNQSAVPELGRWMNKQRAAHRKHSLSDERKKKLDSFNFPWGKNAAVGRSDCGVNSKQGQEREGNNTASPTLGNSPTLSAKTNESCNPTPSLLSTASHQVTPDAEMEDAKGTYEYHRRGDRSDREESESRGEDVMSSDEEALDEHDDEEESCDEDSQGPLDASTWWKVDRTIEPSLRRGATLLLERCMRVCRWKEDFALLVLDGYKQFLEIKRKTEDWDATSLSPSIMVDYMWHQHILDNGNYKDDCLLLCGHEVFHNPDGGLDANAHSIRIKTTKIALKIAFGSDINRTVWNFPHACSYEYENQSGVLARETAFNESTWWHVDCAHEPRLTSGATPLVERCMRAYKWREEFACRVLDGYKNFLEIIKILEDWDASSLLPSMPVGRMWRQHILDNFNYRNDCLLLCGREIIHNPDQILDSNARSVRIKSTQIALKVLDGNHTDSSVWSYGGEVIYVGSQKQPKRQRVSDEDKQITIRLFDVLNQAACFFKISRSTHMHEVFEKYAEHKGIPCHSLRFLLDGDRIDVSLTAAELELEDGDTVDVMLEQCAC